MSGRRRKKRRSAGDAILTIILIIAIGVFCFAGYNLLRLYFDYKNGRDQYTSIAENYTRPSAESETQQAGTVQQGEQAPPETSAGETLKSPMDIDFAGLKSVNEDVIGWIWFEAIPDINYPIVQGKDNDEYLHRTYKRENLFEGSIFMDYQNSADFSDCNTIIYGHNMKDGSMFGKLSRFTSDASIYKNSRYFWIITPEASYRYEIFSARICDVDGAVYTLFKGPGEEFQSWIRSMRRESQLNTDIKEEDLLVTDKVVTLSTCTGDYSTRFILQGRISDVIKRTGIDSGTTAAPIPAG